MAVFSNSTAMSARKSMDRRTLLRGAAVLAPVAALSVAPALAHSHTDIAKRIHALASEMSSLLADLDDGAWEAWVSPAFNGVPMFSVEPGSLSDEARLNQGLRVALGALNRMRPGRWRKEVCLQAGSGLVLIYNLDVAQSGVVA